MRETIGLICLIALGLIAFCCILYANYILFQEALSKTSSYGDRDNARVSLVIELIVILLLLACWGLT
jgi:hypothetical protein